jgi:hypothetical protein
MKVGAIIPILAAVLAIGCGKHDGSGIGANGKAGENTVKVTVISTKGCVNTVPTIDLLTRTADKVGARIAVERVVIATQDEAVRYRFHGSPTVLLDGLDLDPKMRDNTRYGFS